MKAAAYIGRVGGLAVALGIGAAVASGSAVAFADTGDSHQAGAADAVGPKSAGSSRSSTDADPGRGGESGGSTSVSTSPADASDGTSRDLPGGGDDQSAGTPARDGSGDGGDGSTPGSDSSGEAHSVNGPSRGSSRGATHTNARGDSIETQEQYGRAEVAHSSAAPAVPTRDAATDDGSTVDVTGSVPLESTPASAVEPTDPEELQPTHTRPDTLAVVEVASSKFVATSASRLAGGVPNGPEQNDPFSWAMLAAASRQTYGSSARSKTASARAAIETAEPADTGAARPTSSLAGAVEASGPRSVAPANAATLNATTATVAQTAGTLASIIQQLIYNPVHAVVQLWITSEVGKIVDGLINAIAGSYVIGNGAQGNVENPNGGDAGWLLGDGGAGWNSTQDGVAGGHGGRGGLLLGNGGDGGDGGAGAVGGAGGASGLMMGIGGNGGDGGSRADGGVGGAGGVGGSGDGLLLGVGGSGSGGVGGDGVIGGRGGRGGNGSALFGVGGDGGDAGASGVGGTTTGLAALGGAGGVAGYFGSHGRVGQSGTPTTGVGNSGTGSLPPISTTGTWFTDSQGRVVLQHGVNLVYKSEPFYPGAAGFGDDDAQFLAGNGFNVVRLGIIWSALEPEPGVFDQGYLAQIDQTVKVLANHGIYSFLDMHQDLYSTELGGEGAPAWATQTGGLPDYHPGGLFALSYYLSPAQNHAWDKFWSNAAAPDGLGLEDHYALAWQNVAAYFGGNTDIIGYNVMNEPWPGTTWLPTIINGKFFGEQTLTPMYNQVIAAIRSADPTTAVWVSTANPGVDLISAVLTGAPIYLGAIDDPNTVIEYHGYGASSVGTSMFDSYVTPRLAKRAMEYAERTGMPVFMGEFGSTSDVRGLTAQAGAANQYQIGWTNWAYTGAGEVTSSGGPRAQSLVYDPSLPPVGDNVNASNLNVLSKPYPQFVSGTPKGWSTADDGTFQFSYSTARVDGRGDFAAGSRTVISTPPGQFPNGYTVTVTGGQVVSAPNAAQLVIASDTGATTISITVSATQPGLGGGSSAVWVASVH